jgi:hypothetical protein
MKNIPFIFLAIWMLSSSCSNSKQELSREEAMSLIKKEAKYPKVIDYDIYSGDPEFAKKVLDAGLDAQGLVTVQQTQKLSEVGSPLIQFLEKAQPYLMSTPEEDKAINVQKVKLAEEELQEIIGIKMMDDKSAVAEYTTSYINVTPFSALINRDFKEKDNHIVHFSLYDDGWRIEK